MHPCTLTSVFIETVTFAQEPPHALLFPIMHVPGKTRWATGDG